jgi:hypothetical protein
MLIDEIRGARDVIGDYQTASYSASRYQDYNGFLDDLSLKMESFTRYKRMAALLHGYNNELFPKQDIAASIRILNELIGTVGSREVPKKARIAALAREIQTAEENLKTSWLEHIKSSTAELISVLAGVRGLYSDKTQISTIIERVEAVNKRWPFDQSNIDELRNIIAQAQQIITQLDVNEEVQEFLTLVLTGQATLFDLTTDVLEWLNKQGFSKNLKISF